MYDSYIYHFGKAKYDLSSRTHVMGVLNITPDSFSNGGKFLNPEDAVRHAKQMESDGADFIDVGGRSTRPGSEEISLEEELSRVIPVIKNLKSQISIPMSVDTYRSEVADEALKNGAVMVNDISAFNFDKKMPDVIAKQKASCVLMHIKGTPKDMQENLGYKDLIAEVLLYFEKAVWTANCVGIRQIIVDPGIGFGKSPEHNLILLKNIFEFKKLDCPVMIGVSRKSFIGKILGTEVHDRLEGTIALDTIAILNGANMLRVHDVKESVRAARITDHYKKI